MAKKVISVELIDGGFSSYIHSINKHTNTIDIEYEDVTYIAKDGFLLPPLRVNNDKEIDI